MILLVMVLAAHSAFAEDLCSDTDNGGSSSHDDALTKIGEVKYGITSKTDECVISSTSEVRINASKYLLEYFCSNDKRESEIYDCVRLGYSGCEGGHCVGTASATQQSTSQQTQQKSSCGNKIVEKDKAEECDPPGSVCFGRSVAEYGQCTSTCLCKIAKAALENRQTVCGDGYRDEGEDCEEDADCPDNHVCSSCSCVKQLTPEDIERMKAEASGGTSSASKEAKTPAQEIDEKYKTPEHTDVDLSAKNFSDSAAIKTTSGITRFFDSIFSWIADLFK